MFDGQNSIVKSLCLMVEFPVFMASQTSQAKNWFETTKWLHRDLRCWPRHLVHGIPDSLRHLTTNLWSGDHQIEFHGNLMVITG